MVCMPTFDSVIKSKTAESLGNALERLHEGRFYDDVVTHRYPRGYDIARARNFMVRWALEDNADYLLMVDSDMVIPQDAIYNLLEDDVDVALGYYARGTSDDGETAFTKMGGSAPYNVRDFKAMRESGQHLVQVNRAGMGFALIETSVFGRIQKPWFYYEDHADGSGLSEDYWFCRQCQNAGIRVYVDTRVGCGHIKDRVLEA